MHSYIIHALKSKKGKGMHTQGIIKTERCKILHLTDDCQFLNYIVNHIYDFSIPENNCGPVITGHMGYYVHYYKM